MTFIWQMSEMIDLVRVLEKDGDKFLDYHLPRAEHESWIVVLICARLSRRAVYHLDSKSKVSVLDVFPAVV